MKKTCTQCKYKEETGTSKSMVECRRYAPHPVTTDNHTLKRYQQGIWPIVSSNDWCGEFINA